MALWAKPGMSMGHEKLVTVPAFTFLRLHVFRFVKLASVSCGTFYGRGMIIFGGFHKWLFRQFVNCGNFRRSVVSVCANR